MTALLTPPRDPFDVAAVTELAQSQQRIIGSPGYAMPDDYVRDVVALNFKRGNNPEGVLRQLLASVRAGDWRTRLSALNVPTLVMHGRDDPLIPFAAGEDCARSVPWGQTSLNRRCGPQYSTLDWAAASQGSGHFC